MARAIYKPIRYTKDRMPRRPITEGSITKRDKLGEAVEVMGLIEGKQPQSSYEWNIAVALTKLGWSYMYQIEIRGGRRLRGGQVLDFLVRTKPLQTPLAVQGGYWHRNNELEQLKAVDIHNSIGYPVAPLVFAYDKDCQTIEDAYRFIHLTFGRG